MIWDWYTVYNTDVFVEYHMQGHLWHNWHSTKWSKPSESYEMFIQDNWCICVSEILQVNCSDFNVWAIVHNHLFYVSIWWIPRIIIKYEPTSFAKCWGCRSAKQWLWISAAKHNWWNYVSFMNHYSLPINTCHTLVIYKCLYIQNL